MVYLLRKLTYVEVLRQFPDFNIESVSCSQASLPRSDPFRFTVPGLDRNEKPIGGGFVVDFIVDAPQRVAEARDCGTSNAVKRAA
jgi:hypothetical protein